MTNNMAKIRVMFVCHGNICRSPMAEFLLKDRVKKAGMEQAFEIASSATSTEELGNPVHYKTAEILSSLGISTKGKRAEVLRPSDRDKYDYFIGMDRFNVQNMRRILGGGCDKIFRLSDFCGLRRDVADPWYTGDFKTTYDDITQGLDGFLDFVLKTTKK